MDTKKIYELQLNFKFPPDWHSLRTGVSISLDFFFFLNNLIQNTFYSRDSALGQMPEQSGYCLITPKQKNTITC